MSAYVTDDSPLTIIVAGADTTSTAIKAADVGALSIGDKVTITVRNPKIPVIVAIEVEA
jgi:hypothetical protein